MSKRQKEFRRISRLVDDAMSDFEWAMKTEGFYEQLIAEIRLRQILSAFEIFRKGGEM